MTSTDEAADKLVVVEENEEEAADKEAVAEAPDKEAVAEAPDKEAATEAPGKEADIVDKFAGADTIAETATSSVTGTCRFLPLGRPLQKKSIKKRKKLLEMYKMNDYIIH